ncbi:MAG: hypothetical protein V7607_5261 [Solirubrobacteraceae bacterium]
MRVVIAFSAKPRPVVRFVDIPVRIKRPPAHERR